MLSRCGRHIPPLALLAFALLALALLAWPGRAHAQKFPPLTGRVVDAANVIPPDEEARLTEKLAALESQSGRQLVVATLPDLQGYDISDYGYRLGRAWGIGSKERNDGALLIVAPRERKVRIEVGYGLEGVLTDGLSSLIVQQVIVPRFKQGDMGAGIEAGTDAIIGQLTLPEEEARKVAASAQQQAAKGNGSSWPGAIWFVLFLFLFVLPMIRRMRGGRRYANALGPVIVWDALSHMGGGRSGRGWGGGGFSGGGGSFGGGGSSGSW